MNTVVVIVAALAFVVPNVRHDLAGTILNSICVEGIKR